MAETPNDVPVELLFYDLPLCNMVFPLTRYTASRFDAQPELVRNSLHIAGLHDQYINSSTQVVVSRAWSRQGLLLQKGATYRLSPRLVDYNSAKILRNLVDIDIESDSISTDEKPTLLQLLEDVNRFSEAKSQTVPLLAAERRIQSLFQELASLGSADAAALLFKPSQRKAMRRILSARLSVIFGPPGR